MCTSGAVVRALSLFQAVPLLSYSPSEGRAEAAMFNSASSRQALSSCRFIVSAREERGDGWDLTTSGY